MSDMSKKPNGVLTDLIERMKTDAKFRYGITGGVLALILIIIIIICVSCSKKEETAEPQESNNTVSDSTVVTAPGILEETTDEAVLQLVNTYYKALEVGDSATVETVKSDVTDEEKIRLETKANDIESIDNIKVYTRPGMTEGSYVVFIYCEMKFVGIETKAPSFATTYVSTREDGSLFIDSGVDEATMEYVKQVAAEEVIADYFNQVLTNYTNALAADPNLKNYMENVMNQKLDEAVAARQQEAEQAAADQAAAEQQQPQTPAPTPVNETVIATTKVNVRVSDSENADRLGQVEAGTTLTRYETRDNGWSKIDYNGQEGYIKSEFLQVQSSNETPETAEEPEQTDNGGQAEPEAPAETTGKITAKESVRVRASASESGEILGMAYQGESYDLIMEQADGWCKISYNGKTGYVKTDYVEIN